MFGVDAFLTVGLEWLDSLALPMNPAPAPANEAAIPAVLISDSCLWLFPQP